ncbi:MULTISPECIES: hypothetical protein [unclassified Bradyrhizobium]|uniref:hypothetical protein n=1 Tax=unclassified Bradyrhizobium TaxID=2631580 RepID=UPI002FEE8CFA
MQPFVVDRMDHFFLSIICAGILLLVTAFALGTPSMRADVPLERTVLLHRGALNNDLPPRSSNDGPPAKVIRTGL